MGDGWDGLVFYKLKMPKKGSGIMALWHKMDEKDCAD